jgi:hypothetical protein
MTKGQLYMSITVWGKTKYFKIINHPLGNPNLLQSNMK